MSAIGATTLRQLRRVALPELLAVVLASCGAGAGADTKSDPSPQKTGAARAAPRRLLDGDGIGRVKFGQSPAVVAARLVHPGRDGLNTRSARRRAGCGLALRVVYSAKSPRRQDPRAKSREEHRRNRC